MPQTFSTLPKFLSAHQKPVSHYDTTTNNNNKITNKNGEEGTGQKCERLSK